MNSRLDSDTRRVWEMSHSYNEAPNWSKMLEFLNNRARILNRTVHTIENRFNNTTRKSSSNTTSYSASRTLMISSSQPNTMCKVCNSTTHYTQQCEQFLKLTPTERFQKIKQIQLCINCLRSGHQIAQCKSSSCKICRKRHNTLLHNPDAFKATSINSANQAENANVSIH